MPIKYSTDEMEMPGDTKDNLYDEQSDFISSSTIPTQSHTDSTSPQEDDALNFTINLVGKYRIRIYKPLIPLKLVLFLLFGAEAATQPFLIVHFKNIGMTLAEFSSILIFSPVSQFLGTVLSGIAADRLGRSKPILVTNIVLSMTFMICIIFLPSLNVPQCASPPINIQCHPRQFDRLITKTDCDVIDGRVEVTACNVQCPENVTEPCTGQNLICEMLAGNEEVRNFSLSIHTSGSYIYKDRCYYNVSSMSHGNVTHSWCNIPHKMDCRVSCVIDSGVSCESDNTHNRPTILVATMVLTILWLTTHGTMYRFMDVTSMSLIKKHDADYGRERFFSITGILVISPLSGYIVSASAAEGETNNYYAVFYFYIAIIIVVLALLYKLDVQNKPPGTNMWKKALKLLKNPDVMAFVTVILVLGTLWNFTKNFTFWYLQDMSASSFLLGLIPAISSLYGLPFILTSTWWVNKFGAPQIFLLGLIGYVINTTGYSFLQDPWYSLVLEVTNILTYHLLWVAMIAHCHEIAPEGLYATVMSLAGAIHCYIGKSTGSLIGGLIMDVFDGRIAFRVMGIVSLFSAVFYGLYLYIRRTCFPAEHTLKTTDGIEECEKMKEHNCTEEI